MKCKAHFNWSQLLLFYSCLHNERFDDIVLKCNWKRTCGYDTPFSPCTVQGLPFQCILHKQWIWSRKKMGGLTKKGTYWRGVFNLTYQSLVVKREGMGDRLRNWLPDRARVRTTQPRRHQEERWKYVSSFFRLFCKMNIKNECWFMKLKKYIWCDPKDTKK